MLTTKYPEHGETWDFGHFLKEYPYLSKIAKRIHKESFKQYCEEFQEKGKKKLTFDNYIQECVDDYDYDNYMEVLEEYAKEQNWKGCIVEVGHKGDDEFITFTIIQVIPETPEALQELVENYLEHNGMPTTMAELVVDKLVREE